MIMRPAKIVNVRGTSGAGKTTLIRSIMGMYEQKSPVHIKGRKQPLYYILERGSLAYKGDELSLPEEPRNLALLGHYESACGGCDTISSYVPDVLQPPFAPTVEKPNSYDLTFGLIRALHSQGFDVLFEGLLVSGDVARCTKLHQEGLPLEVVCINIPVEECLASVVARRLAAGNEKPFNEANTRDKYKLMQTCIRKLRENGVSVHDCPTRELARLVVADIFDLLPPGQRTGLP